MLMIAALIKDNSWVIYRSSVTVESKGLFLTGFVIYFCEVPLTKMWGNFERALYPKLLLSAKLEMQFLMVLPTVSHNTWFLGLFGSRNS